MKRLGVPSRWRCCRSRRPRASSVWRSWGRFAALIAFEATFRAVQRGIMRPARETLFTVVPRADRYKSKAFIDTFVYPRW